MMNGTILVLALAMFGCCNGYASGPPLSVCRNMTPKHPFEPQTIPSPFTFTLNVTTYRPGDVIEVFLNSSGDWFMEGTLIQMRVNSSGCRQDVPAVGTFSTVDNDVFLEEFSCFNMTASALRHYSHLHIYNRTFYWTAPKRSVGNVYISATIVRNLKTFWLNVTSHIIEAEEACGAKQVVFTSAVLFVSYFATRILT
ncbi:putative defense protein Hdd11 [Ruditapes philippinarum]|uniref:putative defense protein Hdd11 n=1 Tax=Ruditapes philippinarum TaxID=129788 RepID=UPI00295B627C|nr:putative defense protein Hdd11 [Ruditapes philippinarum]